MQATQKSGRLLHQAGALECTVRHGWSGQYHQLAEILEGVLADLTLDQPLGDGQITVDPGSGGHALSEHATALALPAHPREALAHHVRQPPGYRRRLTIETAAGREQADTRAVAP